MIQFDRVTKYYGSNAALRECSFEVPAGSIVGLVGKNGAGKTTALNILSGQLLPSTGDVRIGGEALPGRGIGNRGNVGYLPETPPLYPEMTVAEYLRFAGRLKRMPAAGLELRVAEVMGACGLSAVTDARLGTLARGYRQRVGIAQAIVHDPPLVLLDEPMTGLDPVQIVQIRDLIVSLRPRHTVLFSSHILSEVTQVCDGVVLLDQGSVMAQGNEADLRRDLLQERRLTVLLRGTVADARQALEAIGPKSVEVGEAANEGEGLVRAVLTTDQDLRESASRACLQAGLGLLELREERHGLEELMLQLLESRPGAQPSRLGAA